jgi:hypothetical protein
MARAKKATDVPTDPLDAMLARLGAVPHDAKGAVPDGV